MLFDSIVREDRNVVDLLTADYTFVNERVAKYYGIPECVRQPFPPGAAGAGIGYAPRTSRSRQHADGDRQMRIVHLRCVGASGS